MKINRYYFNVSEPEKYLTHMEAQCVFEILQGKTISKAASVLKLSPRTVEFYLNNVKRRFQCKKKSDLINMMKNTFFEDHWRCYLLGNQSSIAKPALCLFDWLPPLGGEVSGYIYKEKVRVAH